MYFGGIFEKIVGFDFGGFELGLVEDRGPHLLTSVLVVDALEARPTGGDDVFHLPVRRFVQQHRHLGGGVRNRDEPWVDRVEEDEDEGQGGTPAVMYLILILAQSITQNGFIISRKIVKSFRRRISQADPYFIR